MKKRYVLPGLLLILAGVYFLIGALPGVSLPAGAFFCLMGLALLLCRLFWRGKYGLTIAGCITLCLGAGWALLDVLSIGAQYVMVATPLSLALAFFLIHIFEFRRIGNWPMLPAFLLLGFAVVFFLLLTPSVNSVLSPYYGAILPLGCILLGVSVIIRGVRKDKRSRYAAPFHAIPDEDDEPIPDLSEWAQPPLAAEPPAGDPIAVDPVTVEPVVAEPNVVEPVDVEYAVKEPVTKQPAAQKEPATAHPADEESPAAVVAAEVVTEVPADAQPVAQEETK